MRVFLTIFSVFTLISAPLLSAQPAEKHLALRTVVLDPGHGGNDPGCISKDRKTREKDLTLAISKKLADKIRSAYPDTKVILTRDKDVAVPLVNRAKTANDAHANLFISIHINSVASTSPHGFSAHILGQSSVKGRDLYQNNFNECARENSVILLEDDYSTNYQGYDPGNPESSILFSLMQNAFLEQSLLFAALSDEAMGKGPFRQTRGVRQDPFLVLWKTAMPSVLVECGFISNATDLQLLRSEKGLEQIADRLLQAFSEFKKNYDGSLAAEHPAEKADGQQDNAGKTAGDNATDTADTQNKVVSASGSQEVWYGTQILALSRELPAGDSSFNGLETRLVVDGKIYRYIAGCCDSVEAAKKARAEIARKFPDSFVVKVCGTKVERYRE